MHILVTGGAGFIGSHFTRAACAAFPRARVTVLDKLTYGGVRANLDALKGRRGFRFVRGDVCDPPLVGRLLKDCDLLVNFAAETHVDRSLLAAGEFLRTSVLGAFTLLEAARRLGRPPRILHMSTDEVYGPVLRGAAGEDARLDPSSPYSASKAGADLLALAYHRSFGVPVVIARACNLYGPRQFPEKMIPLMATNALRGLSLPVYGDGRQEREWLFVADACRALLRIAGRGVPGRVYNVGSGTWRRNIDVVKRIVRRTGASPALIRHVTDRPGHDRRYAVKAAAIRRLGWGPKVGFEAGLDLTVDWYRDNPGWWKPLLAKTRGYFRTQYGRRLK